MYLLAVLFSFSNASCVVRYLTKWPHCTNLGGCFTNTPLSTVKLTCDNNLNCDGFSYTAGSPASGNGCYKQNCNPDNVNGYGTNGSHMYYECTHGTKCQRFNGGEALRLTCATGQIIQKVYFAGWGTPNGCPNPSDQLSCRRPGLTQEFQTRCKGKNVCDLGNVDFRSPLLGDPCAGRTKWVIAKWECSKCNDQTDICWSDGITYQRSPGLNCAFPTCKTVSGCIRIRDHQAGTLSCPSGQKINSISYANWGLDRGKCGAGNPNSSCEKDARMWVLKHCANKNSCTITPKWTDGFLGDPCAGQMKWIHIKYGCGTSTVQCPCQLYQNCGYGGASTCYWLPTTQVNRNDDYSSIKVASGFNCRVYEHGNYSGKDWGFGGNDDCFTNNEWCTKKFLGICTEKKNMNDRVSSLQITQTTPPGITTTTAVHMNNNSNFVIGMSLFGILSVGVGLFAYRKASVDRKTNEYEELLNTV